MLEYRSREADQAQHKVSLEEKKRVEILQHLRTRESEIQQAFQEYQESLDGGLFDPSMSQVFTAYVQRLKNEKAQLEVFLSQQAQRVNQAREILKQATIKKKSIELLKEKEQVRFKKKLEKVEEAFLSELALNRIIHQSKG